MTLIILLILSYLAGSVNFAIILFKLLGKGDPRESFSGNAGTTNVYRQAGIAWAAVVLVLDAGRAVAVAVLAMHFLPAGQVPWPGLSLVIGNRFPCFHRFRGGKGVASYLGFSLPITPIGAGFSALAWVLVYLMARKPFIASFAMILILAIGTSSACNYAPSAVIGSTMTVLFIVYNHNKNIVEYTGRKSREETNSEEDI
jgi:glycerol-3-phosphate acyltransferase PlsY